MTPTSASTVPLNRLCFDPQINARVSGQADNIDELVASIDALGLLQPLRVRPAEDAGDYLIVVGSRRLTALNKLADLGKIEPDEEIAVTICAADDEEAREDSLAENIVREPMHPVDQFEAFSRLSEAGKSIEKIATSFGVGERLVRQRIALGALHVDIRAAWRAGKISKDAAEAFTLARDPMHQKQIYLRLESESNLQGYHIRAALGANSDAGAALKLVGLDAYRAAGGEVIEDLFGDKSAISDPALAKRMAAEVVQTECKRLVEEDGWSFALPRAKEHWSWARSQPSGKVEMTAEHVRRLDKISELTALVTDEDSDERSLDSFSPEERAEIEAAWDAFDPPIRHSTLTDSQALDDEMEAITSASTVGGFSARQKKKSGCVVDFTDQGVLQVTYGLLRPVDPKEEAKKAKAKKGVDPEPDATDGDQDDPPAAAAPEPAITQALCLALSQQRTQAAAAVLKHDAQLALRAMLATLETRFGSPLKITSNGYASSERDDAEDIDAEGNTEFAARLARLCRLPDIAIRQRLASAIACSIDMVTNDPTAKQGGADALVEALDPSEFTREALAVFDAPLYFKGVSLDLCNKAADEMGVAAKGRPKKKGELVPVLADKAKAHRWLPRELRHPSELKPKPLANAMLDAIEADDAE